MLNNALDSYDPADKASERLEAKIRLLEGKNKVLNSRLTKALEVRDKLEATLEARAQLGEVERLLAKPVGEKSKRKHKGIAVVHWSDWHVGEVVSKAKTNGKNEFNPTVCKRRVEKLAEGTVKLIRLLQQDITIDETVLILGGDFITGYLHPELAETNSMGPVEETYFAQQQLIKAIEILVESVTCKKFRVVCHRGNHGRTTKKMQFKNDFETSHETLMYWNIRDAFNENRIDWVIPESEIVYTEMTKGKFIRSSHGHQIRYNGGVGGLLVPGTRWRLKQDETQKAIQTFIGHFHQDNWMTGLSVVNCLKGWDEYAQAFGFAYTPPSQKICLYDCKREVFTFNCPIFCD